MGTFLSVLLDILAILVIITVGSLVVVIFAELILHLIDGGRRRKEDDEVLLERAKNLVIRVPVIPTFNDTEEEIEAIARFVSGLPNVKELHLLPYHRLGQDKYKFLGRDYFLKDIEPIKDEKIEGLLNAAKRYPIEAQIGG